MYTIPKSFSKLLLFLCVLILGLTGFLTIKNVRLNAKDHQLAKMPLEETIRLNLKTQKEEPFKLSTLKGKWIVFEWFNNDCPFVDKHYASRNMQKLQEKYTAQGVVWLTVSSSQKDRQGYVDASNISNIIESRKPMQSAMLLDHSANLARAFGATATPHMFIVDPEGNVIYQGAIDDKTSFLKSSVEGARNFVDEVLNAYLGKDLSKRKNLPRHHKVYGCSIKNNLKESAPRKPLT